MLRLYFRYRMKKRSTVWRSPGFSLIELMVVIAILITLIGMISPVLASALRQAKQVKVVSNLRGVGQGMFLYLGDSKDRMPQLYRRQKLRYFDYAPGRISNKLREYLGATDLQEGHVPVALEDPVWADKMGASSLSDAKYDRKYRFYTHQYSEPGGSRYYFPWGNPSSQLQVPPWNHSAIPDPTSVWAITEADQLSNPFSFGNSALIPEPLFGDTRCTLYFDGHADRMPIEDYYTLP